MSIDQWIAVAGLVISFFVGWWIALGVLHQALSHKITNLQVGVGELKLSLNGRLSQLLEAVEAKGAARGKQEAIDEAVAKAVASNVVVAAASAITEAGIAGEAKGRLGLIAEQTLKAEGSP